MRKEINIEDLTVGLVLRLGSTTSQSVGLQNRIVEIKAIDDSFLIVEGITDYKSIRSSWEIDAWQWTFFEVDPEYVRAASREPEPETLGWWKRLRGWASSHLSY